MSAAIAANTEKQAPGIFDAINDWACRSRVNEIFELKLRQTTFTRELCAALTVFLTVAHVIAVNPAIISISGGPCSVSDCTGPLQGMPECRDPRLDAGYSACMTSVARSLVATTCISAAIGCFLMAFMANMPYILAPGMGVNAFFTYTMVGEHGSGPLTYQQGLAVVVVVALLVLLISVLGLRGRMMQLFPSHLVFAMVVGLGLFLAMTGLAGSGIGLVVAHPNNLVAAGGCSPEHQTHSVMLPAGQQELATSSSLHGFAVTTAYGCSGGVMQSATTWLGIAACLLIVLLMASKVKAAIAWGVLFATVIAWILGHKAFYFQGADGAIDQARLDAFRQVVSLPNPAKTSLQVDFSAFHKPEAWTAMFGLFYLVFLDATGTAFALAEMLNQQLPGFVGAGFSFPRRLATLVADGLSCIPGALMGTSSLIVTVESSVGIEEGGRTGLVAFLTGCFFLLAMFFAPLLSAIPPYATGPALIIVGGLMVSNARFINWQDITQAFPSFITIAIMPLTYSISNGLLAGLTATFALWLLETVTQLGKALVCREYSSTPGEVLRARFKTWAEAFGDITWKGYKKDLKETFTRTTTLTKIVSLRSASIPSSTSVISGTGQRGIPGTDNPQNNPDKHAMLPGGTDRRDSSIHAPSLYELADHSTQLVPAEWKDGAIEDSRDDDLCVDVESGSMDILQPSADIARSCVVLTGFPPYSEG